MKRWAIYIDIEGFRNLYCKEDKILIALCNLMEGIFLIGTKCYPDSPNRLFAHQTGDGFFIVSEFGSESLETPISIAISLLRHVAAGGRFAKASIGEGEFADIKGCYPETVRDKCDDNGLVRMGNGLMRIFPVMGTAAIEAVKVMKGTPSGATLSIFSSNLSRVPKQCVILEHISNEICLIDWVHTELQLVDRIQRDAGLMRPSFYDMQKHYLEYISNNKLSENWTDITNKLFISES